MKKTLLIFLLFEILAVMTASAQMETEDPYPGAEDSLSKHVPGTGFVLFKSTLGSVRFNPYASFRYLNQKGQDGTYTDAFDRTRDLQRRDDLQMQKVILYFRGWMFAPKFRYVLYTWTSNSNMGQGAQVVIAGNVQYKIKNWLDVGSGVIGLPTSRSMLYSWPHWLRVDTRPMAEEFFRGSYSFGFWFQGEIVKGLYYKTALTNNLSQLGIDAGQLDNGYDTWATMIWWTTNDFGRLAPFGDFEDHKKPSTILGAAYTRSNETRQSQPTSEDPENTQIRLSDGTGVFAIDAFDDSSQVLAAKYQMTSFNAGIKYRGFSLDAEYYLRWITNFETIGTIPVSQLFDHGFSAQASAMLIKKTLQLYVVGSYVDGEYGNPYEVVCGLNWYILKSKALRLNGELIFPDRSPVGYLAYPTFVGSTGTIGMINLEVFY